MSKCAMASDGRLLVSYNQQAYMMFLIRSNISTRYYLFSRGTVVSSPPAERAGPPKCQSLSPSSFPRPADVFLGSCLSVIWLSSSCIQLPLPARTTSSHLLPHSRLLQCHVVGQNETGLGCLDGREHGRLFYGYCGCGSDGRKTLEGAQEEGSKIRGFCNGWFVFSSLKSSLQERIMTSLPSAPLYDVAALCLLACYAYKKLAMTSVCRQIIPEHGRKLLRTYDGPPCLPNLSTFKVVHSGKKAAIQQRVGNASNLYY